MKQRHRIDSRIRGHIYSRLISRCNWQLFEKRAAGVAMAAQVRSIINGIRSQSFERPTGKVMIIDASTRDQREVDGSELPWHNCATKEEFVAKKRAKIAQINAEALIATTKLLTEIVEINRKKRRYELAAK